MTKLRDEANAQEMRDAFEDLLKLIPEDRVRAVELERVVTEYMDDLRRRAEDQLREREEPMTADALDVEMSRLNRLDAQSVARYFCEGRFTQKPLIVEADQMQGEDRQ